jgi:RNA polymerase sigma factor (sigma-70 family)
VFLRAFRALPTLDTDRPVWPWLRRITVNVCTDVLRAPRTWAEEPVGVVPEGTPLAELDPAASLLAAEQRQLIADALDTLPSRHREVLLGRADGVTNEAMAEGEGTTVEAVKSAVKRSRRGFRQAYADLGRERGLLGGGAQSAGGFETAVARVSAWVVETARSVVDNPVFPSLPAAGRPGCCSWGSAGLCTACPSQAPRPWGPAPPPPSWQAPCPVPREGQDRRRRRHGRAGMVRLPPPRPAKIKGAGRRAMRPMSTSERALDLDRGTTPVGLLSMRMNLLVVRAMCLSSRTWCATGAPPIG